MDVSDCRDCRKLLKAELLKGTNPEKLKMKDGHLPGCPSLSPAQKEDTNAVRRPATDPTTPVQQVGWPWSEGQYRIAPSPRLPADAGHGEGGQDRGGRTGNVPPHREPAGGASGRAPAPQPPRRRSADGGEPRGRADVPHHGHASGYAAVAAEHRAKKQHVHQFKVVDHANSGEQRDHRKGVWFVWIVVITLLIAPIFPPILLVGLGAIITLLVIR